MQIFTRRSALIPVMHTSPTTINLPKSDHEFTCTKITPVQSHSRSRQFTSVESLFLSHHVHAHSGSQELLGQLLRTVFAQDDEPLLQPEEELVFGKPPAQGAQGCVRVTAKGMSLPSECGQCYSNTLNLTGQDLVVKMACPCSVQYACLCMTWQRPMPSLS
jgi:hypothetical protein